MSRAGSGPSHSPAPTATEADGVAREDLSLLQPVSNRCDI